MFYQKSGDRVMNTDIYQRIRKIFKRNNGYAYTRDITQAGIHNVYLNALLYEGEIERIKRGLYRWVDMGESNNSTLVDVTLAIPKGVICLQSALSYYNLTTYNPWEVSVAIHRKHRVTLPEYPPVRLYYFTSKVFAAGIEEVQLGRHRIYIYSKEKTVCDCIRYRRQLGKDIIKEMMVEYLKSSNRNLELLMKYAEICGVTSEVENYI